MPNPNQVLSKFRDGFGIKESEAYNLLDEARRIKPDWSLPKVTSEVQKRATRKALLANRSRKPVTLAAVSFLDEGNTR